MKVLYFHQHFSTPKGAAGIRSYAMARALIENGHQVTMVCGSYGQSATGLTDDFEHGFRSGVVDGIDVIEFELSYSNEQSFAARTATFLKYAFRSTKVVFKEDYDLLFATTTPLTAGIPGVIAKIFLRKPFVFEVRDLWPELPKAMGVIKNPVVLFLMKVLEVISYKSADKLVALSPGIKQGILKYKKDDTKVALIPNGCDLSIFNNLSESWQPEGVKDDDFLAVFTGTHGIANGLDQVLDMAKELKNRNIKNIKVLLIGQGKLKPALMERATKEELDNVIFHPPVDKAKLAALMQRANVGLQVLANVPAFYYGTSPNKFFDYISAGLPVINNYPGWLAELIQVHNLGVAVPPEEPKLFAEALIRMSQSHSELDIMSANSLDLAKSEFDRNKLATNFVNWLEAKV